MSSFVALRHFFFFFVCLFLRQWLLLPVDSPAGLQSPRIHLFLPPRAETGMFHQLPDCVRVLGPELFTIVWQSLYPWAISLHPIGRIFSMSLLAKMSRSDLQTLSTKLSLL